MAGVAPASLEYPVTRTSGSHATKSG